MSCSAAGFDQCPAGTDRVLGTFSEEVRSMAISTGERLTRVPAAGSDVPVLEPGDRLTQEEFERRYAAMPALKKAELIEGVVHMPSPSARVVMRTRMPDLSVG
jgi:hypothetical protein